MCCAFYFTFTFLFVSKSSGVSAFTAYWAVFIMSDNMYMLGEKRFTVYVVGSIVIFVYVIALLSTQKSSTRQGLALVPCYLLISFGTTLHLSPC